MDHPYTVQWAGLARQLFTELARDAVERGLGLQFFQAARRIAERLRTDPLDFGDPRFHVGDIEVRIGMVGILFVEFGVRPAEKLVWVRNLVLMTG